MRSGKVARKLVALVLSAPRPVVIVATVLLFIAPVVGLGSWVRDAISTDVAARGARDRVEAAQLASMLLADDLADVGQALRFLSQDPAVSSAFRASDRQALAAELARFRAAWPELMSALALDTRGTEIVISGGGRRSGSLTIDPGQDADRSDRDYYTGARVSSGPFVSEAYRSGAPGQPAVIAISIAVRDGSDLLGVLVATRQPADLIAPLAVADQEGRELVVVDKRGHVVASTDPARVPLSDAGMPALSVVLAGASGSATMALPEGEHVVTYAPVPGASWALYVIDEPRIVLAVERRLQRSVGIAGGVAMLVATLFAAVVIVLFAALSRRSDELARSRSALVRTNAELARADRHKSEFLSSVSHELRTPLNAIIGFTDLLDEQLQAGLSERHRRYLRNVRAAGEHLLGLIDDVLDLSRVETGRIDLRPEPITLQQLFEPVLANARRATAGRGLDFQSEIADAKVRVDPARMRQVLYNLTSNAAKFTKAGGVTCRSWTDGDALVIKVSDTGIGIPRDRWDRVFGMFQRVNEDRSDAKGTGLGLALSKRLVELHGGTIAFDSVEDAYTTFQVRIPDAVIGSDPAQLPEELDAHPVG